ncbi:MAG TPA: hypothetical protein VKU02_09070 [Gemmataceae bacterium]|nr:hypothetical protein [Gemmataceae bacterium]
MTTTLLAICCCCTAAVFIFSLTGAARNALAPIPAGPSPHSRHGEGSSEAVGLTKSQAEDLLDWLEANGRKGKLTFTSGQGFGVC